MANTDFDPRAQPPPLFAGNNLLGTAQGMFGGLRRGFRAGGNALHPYSNRLMLAGLGMLGGGPQDAMKGLVAGSALDTEDADRTKLNKAIQSLMNDPESSGVMQGFTKAEKDYIANDPLAFRTVIAGKLGGGRGSPYGQTPIWGYDAEGNPILMQFGPGGTLNQPDVPAGVTLSPSGNKTIDTGTEVITQDRAGNEISRVPKQPGEVKKLEETGTRQGKIDVPAMDAAVQTMTGMIDDVLKDPALPYSTGKYSMVPALPGSPKYKFNTKHQQLQGQVFKQAYETLKGAGAITDTEGTAAKAAMSRLDLGLEGKDYQDALNDLKREVFKLSNLARKRAGISTETGEDPAGLR